ncbi:MAG: Ppx/GppA phosphatase family protein [Bacteroidota bacterium]|nr:Ppx/GppA phosphatase family protein [Bacteroidota bacterium]
MKSFFKKKYYAAIDMGTNSFHLIIVEVKKNGTFKIVDREKVVLRLGSEFEDINNCISPSEIAEAVSTLKQFKELANFYDAEIITAATSAIREAANRFEFVKIVNEETGIKINVIDGLREGELIFKGITKALNISSNKILSIDIGGGSTELIYSVNNQIEFIRSLKIGAVRLTKMFFRDYVLEHEKIEACKKYIQAEMKLNIQRTNYQIDFAVGTSGTIQSAANMIAYRQLGKGIANYNGFTFYKEQLNKATQIVLGCKTPAERSHLSGIEPKRVDIIPCGLIILNMILDAFKIEKVVISENALREGIILNKIEEENPNL